MTKIAYDARALLEECDAAEISCLIDEVNLLVMERIETELTVEIQCLPHQQSCLEKLPFNVEYSFKLALSEPDCVCYLFRTE